MILVPCNSVPDVSPDSSCSLPSTEAPKSSTTLYSTFSYEIIWDISHFLERNEIEKCQLICQNWNQTIDNGVKFLPLRYLEQLRFNSDGRILLYRYTKFPIATLNIGNLWTFNIQSIEFDIPESNIDFLLGYFTDIAAHYHQPLSTKKCTFWLSKASIGLLERSPNFFTNLIKTNSLSFVAEIRCERFVDDLPTFLGYIWPENSSEVNIRTSSSAYGFRGDGIEKFFIWNGFENKNKLIIEDSSSVSEDFSERYVKLFRTMANPGILYREVSIWTSNNLNQASRIFLEQERVPKINDGSSEVFKIEREDGWTMEVGWHARCTMKFFVFKNPTFHE